MPWFKVDDRLYSHPKWLAAPPAARALWVTAGSWSAAHTTDGHIPRHVLPLLGSRPRDAAELVRVGLWETDGDGWRFHQWLEFQPSADQVQAQRRVDAARQQVARNPELRDAVRARDDDRCRYCGSAVKWSDRRGPAGGTYDTIDPDGPVTLDNLVVACRSCNAAKGRRNPDQAGMRLLPPPGSRSDLDQTQNQDLGRPRGVHDPRPDPTRPEPKQISPQPPSEPDPLIAEAERRMTDAKRRGTVVTDEPRYLATVIRQLRAEGWQPDRRPQPPDLTGVRLTPPIDQCAPPPPELRRAARRSRLTPIAGIAPSDPGPPLPTHTQ